MLDKFIYQDHTGRRFDGLENRVFLNTSTLRDYSWSYDKINNRISRFYQGITTRNIPLVVMCNSAEDAVEVKNRIFEMAETDIAARLPGKVFVGEYYTNGYITASKKSDFLKSKRLCEIDLTLTSDDPAWYREQLSTFISGTEDEVNSGSGTDYPYDYPYDYAITMQGRNIVCEAVESCAFRLEIFGPAESPSINIGGHNYVVNGKVNAGEVLTIDSQTKTIMLTTATGQRVNWFDKRGREEYIFQPIAAGKNSVYWPGDFSFNLTVIEKRSEPKWT